MTIVDHGFNLPAIRAQLDRAPWEEDHDNPGTEIRSVWLGTTFGLTPSGKFYTPFACSNVDACASCHGAGNRPVHVRARVAKRIAARAARVRRSFERRATVNERSARQWLKAHGAWKRAYGPSCTACGGMGSREAYLDSLWQEASEKAMESIGAFLDWRDGDAFATEARDAADSESDESEAS